MSKNLKITKLRTSSIAFLLLVAALVSQSAISSALFTDTETTKVEIETGVLDFYLDEDDWSKEKLEPGQTSKREVKVKDAGWVEFVYDVKAEITGGHGPLCAALYIRAKRENTVVYDGPLAGLNSLPRSSNFLTDEWEFTVTLPSDATNFSGKKCEFDLVFSGWQEDLAVGDGFFDIETLENELSVKQTNNNNNNNNNNNDNHRLNAENSFEGLDLNPNLPDLSPDLPELPELPEVPEPDTEQVEEVLGEQDENLEEIKEEINDITDTQETPNTQDAEDITNTQGTEDIEEQGETPTTTEEIIIE